MRSGSDKPLKEDKEMKELGIDLSGVTVDNRSEAAASLDQSAEDFVADALPRTNKRRRLP